jgi:hypothetical protein
MVRVLLQLAPGITKTGRRIGEAYLVGDITLTPTSSRCRTCTRGVGDDEKPIPSVCDEWLHPGSGRMVRNVRCVPHGDRSAVCLHVVVVSRKQKYTLWFAGAMTAIEAVVLSMWLAEKFM